MSSDHEAEIRASVGAHYELGARYDDAVAEGLVERIGAEIDKRIDARLGQLGAQAGAPPRPQVTPGVPGGSPAAGGCRATGGFAAVRGSVAAGGFGGGCAAWVLHVPSRLPGARLSG